MRPNHVPLLRVQASDIGKGVLILGNLGYPLGERITIRGEWSAYPPPPEGYFPGKPDCELLLVVTSVNGERLAEPVKFPEWRVSPAIRGEDAGLRRSVGDVWEIVGAELGGYEGIPPIYSSETVLPQVGFAFGFYTKIGFSSYRIVRRD